MAATTKAINVGQNALSTNAEIIVTARSGRKRLILKNIDTSIVIYIGHSSGVTSGTGMPLAAGESIALESDADVYAIAASSTPTIAYIEEF